MGRLQVGSMVILTTLLLPAARAGSMDPEQKTTEEVLSTNHLARVRSLYVLDAENDARTKKSEVVALLDELDVYFRQKATYLGDAASMKVLEDRRSRLTREVNDLNVLLGRVPRRRNSVQEAQFSTLQDQRDYDQLAIDEVIRDLEILRNRAPGPQERRQIEVEIEQLRPAYLKAVRELRAVIERTRAEYLELAKDPDVKRVLEQSRRPGGAVMRLGPSGEFLEAIKELNRFESVFPPDSRSRAPRPVANRAAAKAKR